MLPRLQALIHLRFQNLLHLGVKSKGRDPGDVAGGDPPFPARPRKTHLEDMGKLAGNEQLAELFTHAVIFAGSPSV